MNGKINIFLITLINNITIKEYISDFHNKLRIKTQTLIYLYWYYKSHVNTMQSYLIALPSMEYDGFLPSR